MNKTAIEWCDFTVNPIRFRNKETGKVGHYCEKISVGCANCYASRMQTGPYLSGLEFRVENRDKGELFLDEAVLQQVLRRRKPATIFWCDCTDMFGDWVPDEWIDRCAAVVALTPHLRHLWLTKRSRRMREYQDRDVHEAVYRAATRIRPDMWRVALDSTWPLPNLGMGVSPHDQKSADDLIPDLLATPAAMRFVSGEPLLGALDMSPYLYEDWTGNLLNGPCEQHPKLDWVIVGGESGPGARPCRIEWIESIIGQCRTAGVACFVKQLGSNPERGLQNAPLRTMGLGLRHKKGGDWSEWPETLRVQEIPAVVSCQ